MVSVAARSSSVRFFSWNSSSVVVLGVAAEPASGQSVRFVRRHVAEISEYVLKRLVVA